MTKNAILVNGSVLFLWLRKPLSGFVTIVTLRPYSVKVPTQNVLCIHGGHFLGNLIPSRNRQSTYKEAHNYSTNLKMGKHNSTNYNNNFKGFESTIEKQGS